VIKLKKILKKELKVLVSQIKKDFQQYGIKSIYLCGGFARGEGSFLVKKKKLIPLNDYRYLHHNK